MIRAYKITFKKANHLQKEKYIINKCKSFWIFCRSTYLPCHSYITGPDLTLAPTIHLGEVHTFFPSLSFLFLFPLESCLTYPSTPNNATPNLSHVSTLVRHRALPLPLPPCRA
jgi:hypothetical protein